MGVFRAEEAINCLKEIPRNDPLRREGLSNRAVLHQIQQVRGTEDVTGLIRRIPSIQVPTLQHRPGRAAVGHGQNGDADNRGRRGRAAVRPPAAGLT